MAADTAEQHGDLLHEANIRADTGGDFIDDALFDIFAETAAECGESGDLERIHHEARGQKIDGYHLGEGDNPVLTVVVAKFNQRDEVQAMDAKEMRTLLKRAENFVAKAADLASELEQSSGAWRLADTLLSRGSDIGRIKFLLFTNHELKSRMTELGVCEVGGRRHSYHILDLARYAAVVSSRNERDPVEIKMAEMGVEPMPFLKTADTEKYSSYLVAVPGAVLAKIYDLHRDRLLEKNVRTFLQARGKVNRGIIETIKKEPEMFFAYNNGLTATAAAVEERGGKITGILDFQIVNGGQTTASILYARDKDHCDMSRVMVQMKLSVVNEAGNVAEIVSRVSRFANTQNKVSDADFFANDPFHLRMEEFSRRIWAPVGDGELRAAKWFYERARGQYHNAQFLKTQGRRKHFQAEYPRGRMFGKTDMAKYCMAYDGFPHTVGKGAQANFRAFAKIIVGKWGKSGDAFNEMWFKHAVAKMILFRAVDKIAAKVSKDRGYDRGFKAHMSAYSVALIVSRFRQADGGLNCELIWDEQGMDDAMCAVAAHVVGRVGECLTAPPPSHAHLGREWCKTKECWNIVREIVIDISPECLGRYAANSGELSDATKNARKRQRAESGLEWEAECHNIGGEWKEILRFARECECPVTGDMEKAAMRVAGGKAANSMQCKFLGELLTMAEDAGYRKNK